MTLTRRFDDAYYGTAVREERGGLVIINGEVLVRLLARLWSLCRRLMLLHVRQ